MSHTDRSFIKEQNSLATINSVFYNPAESLFNRPLGSGSVIRVTDPGTGSERDIYGSTTLQKNSRILTLRNSYL
jgi:hypothetical protein